MTSSRWPAEPRAAAFVDAILFNAHTVVRTAGAAYHQTSFGGTKASPDLEFAGPRGDRATNFDIFFQQV